MPRDALQRAADEGFAAVLACCSGAALLLDDVAAAHVRCSIGAAAVLKAGAQVLGAMGAEIEPRPKRFVAVLAGADVDSTLPLLKRSIESGASRGLATQLTLFIGHSDAEFEALALARQAKVACSAARILAEAQEWLGASAKVQHIRLGPTTPIPGLCFIPTCNGSIVPTSLEVEAAAIGLAGLLDSLGAQPDGGIWSCGEASTAVASRLASHRRAHTAGRQKVSVVIVDRGLDLVGPASALSSSVLGRVFNGLAEPPGPARSADRDAPLPLLGHGTAAAPGTLSHPGCPEVRKLVGTLLTADERAALHEVRAALLQAGSAAKVPLPLSAKMGKVTRKQLVSYLEPFAQVDAAVLQHTELLQVASMVADSLDKSWAPARARAAPAEKTLLATATDPQCAELLSMLVDLVPLPRKDGAPRGADGAEDELLAPAELLLLAVIAYSLGFPSLDWDSEPQLGKVLTNFLATELPHLGGHDGAAATVDAALASVRTLVKARGNLKRYRSLMGENTMTYEPLIKQIAADLFDSGVTDYPDLHKERAAAKSGGTGGSSGGGVGLLNTGLGYLGGMMGVGDKHPTDADMLVFAVLGGVTCEEVHQVHQLAEQRDRKVQIIFAGTRCVATQEQVVQELFPFTLPQSD